MRLQMKYRPRTNLQIKIPSRKLAVHFSITLSKDCAKMFRNPQVTLMRKTCKQAMTNAPPDETPPTRSGPDPPLSVSAHPSLLCSTTLYYSALQPSTTLLTHLISLSLHRRSNLYGAAQPPWKQWSVIDCSTVLARFPLLWARGLLRLK